MNTRDVVSRRPRGAVQYRIYRGGRVLAAVEEWLLGPHGPLVLDVKVNPTICAEWLEEAFRAG